MTESNSPTRKTANYTEFESQIYLHLHIIPVMDAD